MDPLRPNRVLDRFPADARVRLMPHLDVITVRRDEDLSGTGAPGRFVYFPNTAVLSLLALGSSRCLADVGAVGYEGAVNTLNPLGACPTAYRVIARIPGTITRLPADALRRECRRSAVNQGGPAMPVVPGVIPPSSSVQDVLVRSSQFLAAQAAQMALCNVIHAVPLRLARWLLMLSDQAAGDEMPVTHEMLSEILGVRRPGVTVVLGRLEEAGLIACRRGRISIRNRERLECRACSCYALLRAAYKNFHAPMGSFEAAAAGALAPGTLAPGAAVRTPVMARSGPRPDPRLEPHAASRRGAGTLEPLDTLEALEALEEESLESLET